MEPGSVERGRSKNAMDEIGWLIAAESIRTAIFRYCAAIDRGQYQWLDRVFHYDATIAVGGDVTGLQQFVEGLRARQRIVDRAVHMIGNVLIEPAGSNRAYAESYGLALERRAPTPERAGSDRTLRLRYADQFEHRDHAWKIARRVLVVDHVMSAQLSATERPAAIDGSRDANDPALQLRLSLGLPL